MLDRLLPRPEGVEGRVVEAMRYAALAGGKRLRPFLVTASGRLFDAADIGVRRTATAIEMVHCYSLVHDDLPAMDDDEFRRGQPTCHVKYDEATAILAGDALITLAFGVLCASETHEDAAVRCELVQGLAAASGSAGMVGGQMIDLLAEGSSLDIDAVTYLQALKTGALIAFSCEAGAILGGAVPAERNALSSFGRDLGLAFQIADDLLDVEGSQAETGKGVGKDAAAGKATFVDLLGVDGARARARALVGQATDRLAAFGEKADLLRQVARFVIDRRH
jgi:farnesyl diphosphate synthase